MSVSPENSARNHDHVRIDAVRKVRTYVYPSSGVSKPDVRSDHMAHASRLQQQLADALSDMPVAGVENAISGLSAGILIEIETERVETPTGQTGGLSKFSRDVDAFGKGVVALRTERNDLTEKMVMFVTPDGGVQLGAGIRQYGQAEPTAKGNRFRNVGSVQRSFAARLFVGPVDFGNVEKTWWEIWALKDHCEGFRQLLRQGDHGIDVSAESLVFPDVSVLFVYSSSSQLLKQLELVPGAVFEVRPSVNSVRLLLGEDTPSPHPREWTDDLAKRLTPPLDDAPVVCVLDTGVSSKHPLIAPGLKQDLVYDSKWSLGDGLHNNGHGTPLAGLALLGNLQPLLESSASVALTHGLESVKFIPPAGFAKTAQENLGFVTQGAVAMAEIDRPDVNRSFCIASSSPALRPDSPSSWSGAIDQVCSGSMPGDEGDAPAADLPKRLVMIAAGNMQGGTREEVSKLGTIEDPAQAWNALTIGGFTEFENAPSDPPGYFTPVVKANNRSPFSTGTVDLPSDLIPIKPEVCFEAGNMVADPSDDCDWHSETSLMSTGRDVVHSPLAPFWATSAAVGMAAHFDGRLRTALPAFWPETIRALIVDSARWREPARTLMMGSGKKWKGTRSGAAITKSDRQKFLREHGYGVPDWDRAHASARNAISLIAEAEIQPFALNEDGNGVVLKELHLYSLPWPRKELQAIGDGVVTMRVTLSYFIEPNLSGKAATRPDTYRSFGLRFDLKKRSESENEFVGKLTGVKAKSKSEEESVVRKPAEGGNWFLGPKAISAGSLHCDIWRGTGTDLALHDMIAVFPTTGWWKTHKGQHRYDDRGRYSLIVSISADEHDVDLLTEINVELAASLQAEIEI